MTHWIVRYKTASVHSCKLSADLLKSVCVCVCVCVYVCVYEIEDGYPPGSGTDKYLEIILGLGSGSDTSAR